MYSSLSIALSTLWILKYGWARQRAVASIHIVSMPVFPSVDMNVCRLGVNLNGTDLLASNSPTIKECVMINKEKLYNFMYTI